MKVEQRELIIPQNAFPLSTLKPDFKLLLQLSQVHFHPYL